MRKSTVIATCLVNSNFFRKIEEAEASVQNIFRAEFPHQSFQAWNRNIPDITANNIIKSLGRASLINVKKFIEDLWE